MWHHSVEVFVSTRNPSLDGHEFHVGVRQNETLALAQPLTIEEVEEAVYTPPCFVLTTEKTQALFDQLYQQGFRPSRKVDTERAVEEAQKAHILDLKTIVAHLLEMIS